MAIRLVIKESYEFFKTLPICQKFEIVKKQVQPKLVPTYRKTDYRFKLAGLDLQ